MKLVILSGGLGTRLSEETHKMPDEIIDRVRKDKIKFKLPIPRPRKSSRDNYILNKNI